MPSEDSQRAEIARTPKLPRLPYTGERMMPGQVPEALFMEHEARYVFAGSFVKDKVVLDVACGAGIGTHYLLNAGARSCLGIDIDTATIEEARTTYRGCRFERCDATSLRISENTIDVVVSFETIEHLRDQSRFLSECHRVLKPGGVLICSTPNRTMTRWKPANPYHLHEFTVTEFRHALELKFANVQLFGQENSNQAFFAFARLLSRALHTLGVMDRGKKMLRWNAPAVAARAEYGEVPIHPAYRVESYHPRLFVQPLYLVAVANKVG